MDKKKTTPKAKHSEAAQIGRFGLVGILNTVVDFIVYNLIHLVLPSLLPAIAAVISGTVAMVNSFVFNKNFTFRTKKLPPAKLILFFALTIVGIYIIRPIVVGVLTGYWLWPGQVAYRVAGILHLPLSQDFVSYNTALVAAILIVLVYNYLTYKYFIFNEPTK